MRRGLLRAASSAAAVAVGTAASSAAFAASAQQHSSGDARLFSARITAVKDVASTRWLKLQTVLFEDQRGQPRAWDMLSRTARAQSAGVDGVVIVPLLRTRRAPADVETLVVLQFRPPVGAVSAELPAGLVDEGETAEQAAVRELKEETGYVGTATITSGVLANCPFLVNDVEKMVVVDVDLDSAENQLPTQQLEDSEFISVRRVKLSALQAELQALEGGHGRVITCEGLRLLALGWHLREQLHRQAKGEVVTHVEMQDQATMVRGEAGELTR